MSTMTLSSGRLSRPLPLEQVDKKHGIQPFSRWMVLFATFILPVAYFTPIWRIQLWAPQYPEGLEMKIWINHLTGSINIINELNHYIGMANIEEAMFPELKFLTYLLAVIIALGAATFIFNRQGLLRFFTAALVIFALAALVDMYIWGYKYGHNLNPQAAIKIDGASYQPPLIGYKQLLNFLALSAPDKGGFTLFGAGLLALIASFIQFRKNMKTRTLSGAALLLICSMVVSCQSAPEKIEYNKDDCAYCGMRMVDEKFGAMIVSDKGKQFKFDDVNCMMSFKTEKLENQKISKFLVVDFSAPGKLINAESAYFLKSEDLKSPMGGNLAGFAVKDSLERVSGLVHGEAVSWKDVNS